MAGTKIAEETLAKLDQQLNCSICLETYTDPKLLRCGHYFCLQCLVRLLRKDDKERFYMRCPTCRTITRIPNTNVAGLQPAFHINDLKSIRDTGRQALKKVHHCSEHSSQELELYCQTCKKLICFQCAIAGENHHCHSYELLTYVANACLKELQEDMLPSCLERLERLYSRLQIVKVEATKKIRTEVLEKRIKLTSSRMNKVCMWKSTIVKKREHFLQFFEKPVQFQETIKALLEAHQDLKSFLKLTLNEIEKTEVPPLLNPSKCCGTSSKGLVSEPKKFYLPNVPPFLNLRTMEELAVAQRAVPPFLNFRTMEELAVAQRAKPSELPTKIAVLVVVFILLIIQLTPTQRNYYIF